jgi:hypothetical protein
MENEKDRITCEKCLYHYPDDPYYWPLTGVNHCRKCLGLDKKPKRTGKEDRKCDLCGRVKPYDRFSAEESMKLNKSICYLCARRAGVYKPHVKVQCHCCGLIKSVRLFPADYIAFGGFCKKCIKSGKYTKLVNPVKNNITSE